MIKKYHVSKQLFDISSIQTPTYANQSGQDGSYSYGGITDGVFTCKYGYYGDNRYINYPISLQAGTYTLSFDARGESSDFRIRIIPNEIQTSIYLSTISDIDNTYKHYTATFTLESDTTIRIEIQMKGRSSNYQNLDFQYKNIMLNTGSQPLPYEPYGDSFKDWFYREYGTETETFTSLPKTIIGDGQPISSWSMDGNMQVNGTPTPQNPITPAETGDKTANLFSGQYSQFDSQGGTGSVYNYFQVTGDFTFTLKAKGTFRTPAEAYFGLTGNGGNADGGYQWVMGSNSSWTEGETRTVYSTTNGYHFISIYPKDETTFNWINEHFDVMLNAGSIALPYEPYGYKIPISFGGVTYPIYLSEPIRKIADSVDTAPSTGTASRIIKKLAFDGTENVSYNARNDERQIWVVTIPTSGGTTTPDNVLSTHFVTVDSTTKPLAQGGICMRSTGNDVVIGGSYSDIGITSPSTSTIITDAVKQFLADQYAAGTPVTVWYVLATAKTESFTAPTIPTSGTAQSFDVDTTPKPSEVSLTWHGWHEHSDTKFTTP